MGKPIISQRRGKGSIYRSPAHRHKGAARHPRVRRTTQGVVEDIQHDPGRTAPIAIVRLEDGSRHQIIAPEGLHVGQELALLTESVENGNILTLRQIPEGTPIFNIESQPGDGGKFVRSAGTNAIVVSQDPSKVIVRLPSGTFKAFHPACRASVGVVAGGGRGEKPFGKAGKRFHAAKSRGRKFPRVSGVAMNPVDHPHGGGNKQHIGRGMAGRRSPPGSKVGSVAGRRTGKR